MKLNFLYLSADLFLLKPYTFPLDPNVDYLRHDSIANLAQIVRDIGTSVIFTDPWGGNRIVSEDNPMYHIRRQLAVALNDIKCAEFTDLTLPHDYTVIVDPNEWLTSTYGTLGTDGCEYLILTTAGYSNVKTLQTIRDHTVYGMARHGISAGVVGRILSMYERLTQKA